MSTHGYWVLSYESYLSIGYNTSLVSDAEAPKTLDDLLDPKWKGKMGFAGTSTLANWIGAVLKEKDEAYLRKLALQNIRVIPASARAVANMVISGELWLSPTILQLTRRQQPRSRCADRLACDQRGLFDDGWRGAGCEGLRIRMRRSCSSTSCCRARARRSIASLVMLRGASTCRTPASPRPSITLRTIWNT